jgi:outer membrane protein insertion porin family
VRGYEPSSLGPRDASTGDPTGGSKPLVGNVELTFPLPGTGYDRTLRVFAFLDPGNVGGDEGNSAVRTACVTVTASVLRGSRRVGCSS